MHVICPSPLLLTFVTTPILGDQPIIVCIFRSYAANTVLFTIRTSQTITRWTFISIGSRFFLRPHGLRAAPLSRRYLEFRPWRQSPNGRKGGRVLSPHSTSPSTPLISRRRPQPLHQPRLRSTLLTFFSLRSEWAPFHYMLVGCWLMCTGLNGQQIKLRRTGASLCRRL